jgi:REP element-mobilizing transposase RayT
VTNEIKNYFHMKTIKFDTNARKTMAINGPPQPQYCQVTLITLHRQNYFGMIHQNEMHLSPAGIIACFAARVSMQSPAGVRIDEWVVMPNHVHLIFCMDVVAAGTIDHDGETTEAGAVKYRMRRLLAKNRLAQTIMHFKAEVKRWTRMYGLEFAWRRGAIFQIISDGPELDNIRWNLRKNQLLWDSDPLNRKFSYLCS